ncbi:AMP-binding protein [Nocardioides soli]|uniref:Fatty-acyl-CoA synthase n=1 Tax=Nocardioides soli TaxID=1036020 RepID=A0A7W4VVV4_9ACTN|nr:AMP-binding protein [Nocardioides soli]MBB3042463.1 fatty-acyl-CoA synthase [Nocardioides soli]
MMRHDDTPLSPVGFLDRAAAAYADKVALIDGETRYTYGELHLRATRLAGALFELDLRAGGRVAVLAPNTHEMLEAHYGVPYATGVLVPLNSRLSAAEIAYVLRHSEAKILIVAAALEDLARDAIRLSGLDITTLVTGAEYEAALAVAMPYRAAVRDERATIAINYTSGTTGTPKGVVYTHRGAYLQSLAMAFHSGMGPSSSYLWTLPMFHCNGWCFTWAVTAAGATHVCLERVEAGAVWNAIADHSITHLCAAPTVLSTLTADPAGPTVDDRSVWVATGGAPPAPALLARARRCGLEIVHLYGMTETYGPSVINEWRDHWHDLPLHEQDRLKARQGIGNIVSDVVRVVDSDGLDVPADATTVGEIAMRGNNVTPRYHLDPESTAAAVPDGWFRSGDLAVRHPDGYVEIRDRAKDVIISGGENISSVEVEQAILEHPAVQEAAVVAMPHEHWGERPVAFVSLRDGSTVSAAELRDHLVDRVARFKIPDRFEFATLPKTSTGKVQKFELKKQLAAPTTAGSGSGL